MVCYRVGVKTEGVELKGKEGEVKIQLGYRLPWSFPAAGSQGMSGRVGGWDSGE